jgi:uncharacterized integral membrane protein
MRIVTWTIRLVLLLFLIVLAARNVEPVTLRFYSDFAWQAPLILLLFGAFAAGALFGILALVGTLLRQRREISALKKKLSPLEPSPPPPPF